MSTQNHTTNTGLRKIAASSALGLALLTTMGAQATPALPTADTALAAKGLLHLLAPAKPLAAPQIEIKMVPAQSTAPTCPARPIPLSNSTSQALKQVNLEHFREIKITQPSQTACQCPATWWLLLDALGLLPEDGDHDDIALMLHIPADWDPTIQIASTS